MRLEKGEFGVFPLDNEGFEIASLRYAENKKQAVAMAKRYVQNKELIVAGLYKVEVRNHREEIVADFFVKQEVNHV